MEQLNVLAMETRYGYRTFELYHGDITKVAGSIQVLIVSAYAGSYYPSPGTVFNALNKNHGIWIEDLAANPSYDFRDSLGFWISAKLDHKPFERIICAELLGAYLPYQDILTNVFIGASILEAKGFIVKKVALPILGAGLQGISPEESIGFILPAARDYLLRSVNTDTILFVEKDWSKANRLSIAMDQLLGRRQINLPRDELLNSLTADVADKIVKIRELFNQDQGSLREDWLRLCRSTEVRPFELGVLSRKFVELMLDQLDVDQRQSLNQRIKSFEDSKTVAPWICGYMNVLRQIGNEAAHINPPSNRKPPYVEKEDLSLALLCVQRLLEFWERYRLS